MASEEKTNLVNPSDYTPSSSNDKTFESDVDVQGLDLSPISKKLVVESENRR